MKKLTWEQQKEYNLNLEYLYSLRDRNLELREDENIVKIEFKLFTDVLTFTGVEYLTDSVELGSFDTIEEAVNKYIDLKLEDKLDKHDNSFIKKFIWTKFDGSDEVWGNVHFTVNVFNANYGDEYITLKEWAEREGISDITARAKARNGMFDSAKKYGRQWFIKASEKNIDNRLKENK